jgi:uncharacterized protein YbbC (DUF1343 family)
VATFTGLDVLAGGAFELLKGKTIGVVCNQATVDRQYVHLLDLLLPLHRSGDLRLQVVFGPQHGLFGHTQDNMIEWEGSSENRWGVPIYSLYGADRSPDPSLVKGLDQLVIDLPDVGSRYYTFLWTTALCMEVCEATGTPVTILDRPNPIGGLVVEGPVLDREYASFVGLYPLPTRHGMSLGEIASYFKQNYFPHLQLAIECVRGWSRSDFSGDTDVPWVMPSPNMPTADTAMVYPGGCLLEGTNLSEGRGTTRPFETIGAPFIDGWELADALNELWLPGCIFRPTQFQPTFQKHAKAVCEGCFVQVVDRRAFEPVLAYFAILREVRKQYGTKLRWNDPPYEYETKKLPIDILAGNGWLRKSIDGQDSIAEVRERMMAECEAFRPLRESSLLYPFA